MNLIWQMFHTEMIKPTLFRAPPLRSLQHQKYMPTPKTAAIVAQFILVETMRVFLHTVYFKVISPLSSSRCVGTKP
jgi:hypothetical protein